jgi:predicted nucleic acid-binding Zn ribbon protein
MLDEITKKQVIDLLLNKRSMFNTSRFKKLPADHPIKLLFNSELFKDCLTPNEIFYRIRNNIEKAPICPTCGQSIKYEKSYGYHKFCSCRCAQLDENVRQKNKDTNLKLYGVENGAQAKESIQKYKKTCLKLYGSTNYFSSDIGKSQIKKTCLEKYGVDNCRKSEQVKIKFKQTCLKKYGVEYPSQNYNIRIKSQQKYLYDNKYFDSSLELYYYIYLKDKNIKFEYQPNIQYQYKDGNNKSHTYFPDFIVDGVIIEIKGGHFLNEDKMINPYDSTKNHIYEAKYKCMIHNNIKILTENDIKPVIKYIDGKYGKTFIKQFKKIKNNELL